MVCWEKNRKKLVEAAENAGVSVDELRRELKDDERILGHEHAEKKFNSYLKIKKKRVRSMAYV